VVPAWSWWWALRPLGEVPLLLIAAAVLAFMRMPGLVPAALVGFAAWLFVEAWAGARWRLRAALQEAGQLVSGDLGNDD